MLLRLAHPLFIRALHSGNWPNSSDSTYEAWVSLRLIAERYFQLRSTNLQPAERERMIGALTFAHDSHHESVLTTLDKPSLHLCGCEVAQQIRELSSLLQEVAEREKASK